MNPVGGGQHQRVLAALFLVSLVLPSCGAGVVNEPGPDAKNTSRASGVVGLVAGRSSVVESSVATLTGSAEGSSGSAHKSVVIERPPASYLREIVPPCLPVGESEQDPCRGAPRFLPTGSTSGWPAWQLMGIPSINEVLLGKRGKESEMAPIITPHIVIRGLVQEDTTRCDLYPYEYFSYRTPSITGFHYYYCFADISVHEYIVGEGPAELTVALHREVLFVGREEAAQGWNVIKDYVVLDLKDPQSGTASLYEGKEVVLLLGTTTTVALESWTVNRTWGKVWFLQRNDNGEIRAWEKHISRARTPEERSRFDLPLSELARLIKEATEHRATVTGGRIGEDPNLPMLVTDANRLQDFYRAVGAVYEGEDATVLPPPVPGAGRTRTGSDLSR